MRRIVQILCAVIAMAGSAAAAEPRVPVAAPFPADAKLLAYAVVPSIATLLTHIEDLAHSFTPMVSPGMLTMQLGGMIGDPGLANLDTTRPVVFLLLAPEAGSSAPTYSLWIPSKDPSIYISTADMFKKSGLAVGSLAVIASTPGALDHAKGMEAVYAAVAADPVRADIRLRLAPDRTMTAFKQSIKEGLDSMVSVMENAPKPANAANPTANVGLILQLEAAVVTLMAASVADYQSDLTLSQDALTIRSLITAVPDSRLAHALVPGHDQDPSGVLPPGLAAMSISGSIDGAAAGAYVMELLQHLGTTPGMPPIDPRITAAITQMSGIYTGAFASRLAGDAVHGLSLISVYGVTDPTLARAALIEFAKLCTPDGPLNAIYKTLGMTFSSTYVAKVRQSGGQQVDRFDFAITSADPQQQLMMKNVLKPSEIAFVGSRQLMAQDPAELDALIARAAQPLPAPPADSQGRTADLRIDYDYVKLMQIVFATMGDQPGPMAAMHEVMAKLPTGDPIRGRVFLERGRALTEVHMPLKPFILMSQGMMQMRQNAPGNAPPHARVQPPPPEPEKPTF